jgi:hypothetical protein
MQVEEVVEYGTVKTYIERGIWIGNLADSVAELCRNFANALVELKVTPEHSGYFSAEVVYRVDEVDPKTVPSYGRCPICGFEDPEFLVGLSPGSPAICPNCRRIVPWEEVRKDILWEGW